MKGTPRADKQCMAACMQGRGLANGLYQAQAVAASWLTLRLMLLHVLMVILPHLLEHILDALLSSHSSRLLNKGIDEGQVQRLL